MSPKVYSESGLQANHARPLINGREGGRYRYVGLFSLSDFDGGHLPYGMA